MTVATCVELIMRFQLVPSTYRAREYQAQISVQLSQKVRYPLHVGAVLLTNWQNLRRALRQTRNRRGGQCPGCAAAPVSPERCFVALASGYCCLCVADASFLRLKTTASMALITFCCMIWFLSIVRCPMPILPTSTFSSAPWNCWVFETGVRAPLEQ